jgi:hypothetical protein
MAHVSVMGGLGVTPSVCTDNSTIGECYDAHGLIRDNRGNPARFNCSACCALRGAVAWRNPNTNQVVNC